jgi:hypothetical protein
MKLFTTALVAVTAAVILTPDAKALEYREGTIAGYRVEVIDSGSYTESDYIEVYGPNGKEQITVTCAPFYWESYGANTAQFAETIAKEWCF